LLPEQLLSYGSLLTYPAQFSQKLYFHLGQMQTMVYHHPHYPHPHPGCILLDFSGFLRYIFPSHINIFLPLFLFLHHLPIQVFVT